MQRFYKSSYLLPIVISLILFFIPFFWLHLGEMDLGGDSSRLYFYDPLAYLKNVALYGIYPEGIGTVAPNYFYIPYLFLLIGVKTFLSSTLLITVFNCLKIVVGFLFIYAILFEFIKIDRKET